MLRSGFWVLWRRSVAKRTFARLGTHRRLGKVDEALPETEGARVHLAVTGLLLAQLDG